MNGHDDDELDIYSPDEEERQRQADDDEAAWADLLDTYYWFLAETH